MKGCSTALASHFKRDNKMRYSAYLMLLLSLAGCGRTTEHAEMTGQTYCIDETLKTTTTIDTLQERQVSQHLTLTGEISYNPDNVVRFVSLVEGVATTVGFSLGDYVKKGQVLASIKSPELNALWSEKTNLENRLKIAEREYAAAKGMYEDHIASERDLLAAQSEVNTLKAELGNIGATLALFNPNPVQGTFEIISPRSGYVVEKNITVGMQINDGEDLFTLSALDEVWVMVNVYATDMQFVQEGMEVVIHTLAYPDDVFSGKISALSQVFDAEERVLKGRVVLDNKSLKLKPGMSADIVVEKLLPQTATVVPSAAVIFDNNQHFAVVYHNDCELEVRNISLSAKGGQWYFVDQGLLTGEQIITQNHLLIYEQIKSR